MLLQTMLGEEPMAAPEDLDIIDRALWQDAGRGVTLHGGNEWQPAQDGAAFRWMAQFIRQPLRERLDAMSDHDLVVARDETRSFLNFSVSFGETMLWIFPKAKGLGFGFASRVVAMLMKDPRRRAFLVVQYHALRNDPALRQGILDFRSTANQWNDDGYAHWTRIRFIAENVPGARTIIGEARVREAFKNPRGFDLLAGEVAQFRVDHAEEIDALVAAHPEMFGPIPGAKGSPELPSGT
jgi:hypothetical protein